LQDRLQNRVQNRVLAVLVLAGLAAAWGGSVVTVAPNRLVTGRGLALGAVLAGPWWALLVPAAVLACAVFWRPQRRSHTAVAIAAAALLAGLLALTGEVARGVAAGVAAVVSPGLLPSMTPTLMPGLSPGLARVSLGGGFWALAGLAGLAAADAVQRLGWAPAARAAALATLSLPLLGLLAAGQLDALSLLKEYANRAEVFQAAGWRHLQIVGGALLPALLTGLPLGLWAARSDRLARPLFGLLNIIQTLPSIALFGLLIAPLAALAAWLPGWGIAGIGLLPALIALALYALLPVVHGMAAGLRQVPAAVLDAGRGMGLTPRQLFWRVELPLAAPVLVSGLRVTVVQLIGLAVVAALIGAGGFGTLVFQGLAGSALDLVLLGVLPVVVMALLADAGLVWLGSAVAGPQR
jgi:osmoprotectant transport system permease protein